MFQQKVWIWIWRSYPGQVLRNQTQCCCCVKVPMEVLLILSTLAEIWCGDCCSVWERIWEDGAIFSRPGDLNAPLSGR